MYRNFDSKDNLLDYDDTIIKNNGQQENTDIHNNKNKVNNKTLYIGGWKIESDENMLVEYDSNFGSEDEFNHEIYLSSIMFDIRLEKNNPYLNTSSKYKYNNCYCCKNYILIHPQNENTFISKYLKFTNREKCNIIKSKYLKPSSKNIKILFRLKPELFKNIDIKNIKYLDSLIPCSILNLQDRMYQFEILFYNNNSNNIVDIDSMDFSTNCTICDRQLCQTHIDFNPFYIKKCICCSKTWYICSWCKFDKLFPYFVDDELTEIDVLCKFFHR